MKKKILFIILMAFMIIPLYSCENIKSYKNEVTFSEFNATFKELIKSSLITEDLNFDFTYTLKGHEKYQKGEMKTNSVINHDKQIGFTKWETIEDETKTLLYVKEDYNSIIFYDIDENNNVETSEASIIFEKYMKINVLNSYNYNFIPVNNYKCYHDVKNEEDIFTIIYSKDTMVQTIQYVISDTLVSKCIKEEYDDDNKDLKYKYLYYEFKIDDIDLSKEYKELGLDYQYGQ